MTTKKDALEPDPTSVPTFEQALSQLEAVVRDLEDGRLGLDASLARYEDGVRLLKNCHEALNHVERKISLLTGIDANGHAITEPFSEEAESLDEKKAARTRRRSRANPPVATADSVGRDDDARVESDETDHDMDRQKGLF